MEPKAHYVAVGSFVLALLVGIIVFVSWIGKSDLRQNSDTYAIYFQGSVSGLQTGSNVLYRGVPVGHVADISIAPDNPELIRVLVDIRQGTPIKQDALAELEMVGVTGLSQVQITGGTAQSPSLTKQIGAPYPVIASAPSKFEEIFSAAPQILYKINMLLNEENLTHVTEILANLNTATNAIADMVAEEASLESCQETAGKGRVCKKKQGPLGKLVVQAQSTLHTFDKVLHKVEDALITLNEEGGSAARSFADLSQSVASLIDANKDAIDHFLNNGLFEFVRLVSQLRTTLESINSLTQGVERDPLSFFLGAPSKGFVLHDTKVRN